MDDDTLNISNEDPRAARANELARELVIARRQVTEAIERTQGADHEAELAVFMSVVADALNELAHEAGDRGRNRLMENVGYLVAALASGGSIALLLAEALNKQSRPESNVKELWATMVREHGSF